MGKHALSTKTLTGWHLSLAAHHTTHAGRSSDSRAWKHQAFSLQKQQWPKDTNFLQTLAHSGGAVPDFHRSSLLSEHLSKMTDHQHTVNEYNAASGCLQGPLRNKFSRPGRRINRHKKRARAAIARALKSTYFCTRMSLTLSINKNTCAFANQPC